MLKYLIVIIAAFSVLSGCVIKYTIDEFYNPESNTLYMFTRGDMAVRATANTPGQPEYKLFFHVHRTSDADSVERFFLQTEYRSDQYFKIINGETELILDDKTLLITALSPDGDLDATFFLNNEAFQEESFSMSARNGFIFSQEEFYPISRAVINQIIQSEQSRLRVYTDERKHRYFEADINDPTREVLASLLETKMDKEKHRRRMRKKADLYDY